MQPRSEDDVARAMEAVQAAPMTESGIVIPPHVQAERDRQADEETFKPNRAQRRWQAKQARRRGNAA